MRIYVMVPEKCESVGSVMEPSLERQEVPKRVCGSRVVWGVTRGGCVVVSFGLVVLAGFVMYRYAWSRMQDSKLRGGRSEGK